MINLDAILNDPAQWKDPETFRPERHLSQDSTKLLKNDYFFPFSAGM